MKTLLQSIPSHPLDGIQAKLFEESFALKAGVASDWPEAKISMQCLVEKLADSPEVSAKIAIGIGNWVLERFRDRDADALRKLAKCWESGGLRPSAQDFRTHAQAWEERLRPSKKRGHVSIGGRSKAKRHPFL